MESNPYQSQLPAGQAVPPSSSTRSSKLAYFSLGLAIFVGLAILSTQGRFWKLFVEFEIQLPLLTSMVVRSIFPISLLCFGLTGFLIGLHRNFQSVANRVSLLVIICSITSLIVYIMGIALPLINLITALSD